MCGDRWTVEHPFLETGLHVFVIRQGHISHQGSDWSLFFGDFQKYLDAIVVVVAVAAAAVVGVVVVIVFILAVVVVNVLVVFDVVVASPARASATIVVVVIVAFVFGQKIPGSFSN